VFHSGKEDWNNFFKHISHLKLCPVHSNDTSYGPVHKAYTEAVLNTSSDLVDQSKSMSAALSNVVDSSEEVDFTEILMKVEFSLIGKTLPSSFFQVNGRVRGSLLSFTGKYASVLFNVSLNFLSSRKKVCSEGKCKSVWDVCIRMSVPSDLLFEAKNPDRCRKQVDSLIESRPTFILDSKDSYKNYLSSPCLLLDYTPNAKLTDMLTLHDRSIVNLHLMHTSYFMFFMVMTLICYSLIKGRNRQHNNSLEKALLET